MSYSDTHTQKHPKYIWSRGMRFPFDPNLFTAKRRTALREGSYEKKEFSALRKLAQPDDVALDLGAGIGFLTTALAVKFGVRSVCAVEANPALIPMIEATLRANAATGVKVRNRVLAVEDGPDVPFYVRADFVASSATPDAGGRVVRTEHVPRCGIGSLMAEIKPSLLVCDIEGAEADLLPHADLSHLRAAVVELHPKVTGPGGIRAVFDAMHAGGLAYDSAASHGRVVAFRR